jgi:hypothetical protein
VEDATRKTRTENYSLVCSKMEIMGAIYRDKFFRVIGDEIVLQFVKKGE